MKTAAKHLFIIAFFSAGAALAAGGGPDTIRDEPVDPVVQKVLSANERSDWAASQAILREALAKDAGNADYHNLYAYAIRKGGSPDMDLVFKHYNEALRIDPKHRGAHEYLGEAYLMLGNVAKAKEHLAALDRLCFFGCAEYTMLKKAVADYEAKQAKK